MEHQMETYYEFNFKITCKRRSGDKQSRYITVNGTSEYASSYVAGYIQALQDKGSTNVEVERISATYITGSFPTKELTKEVH